ncbi:MAG: hypothetical protein IKA17_00250 [Clostridia bacterium]|nr:hypothetical protein [Clostridia bacterium]
MKKLLSIMLALIIAFSLASIASAAQEIKIMVGGKDLYTDVAPTIIDGRVMLPVRDVFESIDARVSYDSATRTVTAVRKGVTVQFVIDSNAMKVNGAEKAIDVPATIVNGRTLVPLRACAEAFDLDVTWNKDTRTARIKKPVSLIVESSSPLTEVVRTYTYDENGNQTGSFVNGNVEQTFEYTEDGKLLYKETKDSVHTSWVRQNYDIHGNRIYYEQGHARNENFEPGLIGEVTTYTYDDNSNLLRIDTPTGSTTFTYDSLGRMLTETAGSWVTTHTYTGNTETQTDPYGGVTTYTYDANGNLLTMDSDFSVQRNKYDSYGRLIESYSCIQDLEEETIYYTYDANGKLASTSGPGFSTSYTYNEYGKILTKTDADGTYYYTYDADGNLIQEEDGKGNWKKYINDENGNCIQTETNYGTLEKYIVVVK